MNPQQNVSLAAYSTMGLGGEAAYLIEIDQREQVPEAWQWAQDHGVPLLMIGGGSNIVWRDEGFPGLVVVNKLSGFTIDDTLVTVGAGENWDSVVERCVAASLSGIEALSLIPGSAGATPVQNVGAYGQEIAETLVELEAFDTQAGSFVTLAGDDCGFGYRASRFKTGPDRGRFLITQLKLRLSRDNPRPPFYAAVQKYFDEHKVTEYTPAALRAAVLDIRTKKLPDPAVVRNTGSFFANPVIYEAQFQKLQAEYADMPHWPAGDGQVKVPAAWLLDHAGLKDVHDDATGMATWPTQPLVLVNERARSTADLLKFKQHVIDTVQAKFGIMLEQEPELLP